MTFLGHVCSHDVALHITHNNFGELDYLFNRYINLDVWTAWCNIFLYDLKEGNDNLSTSHGVFKLAKPHYLCIMQNHPSLQYLNMIFSPTIIRISWMTKMNLHKPVFLGSCKPSHFSLTYNYIMQDMNIIIFHLNRGNEYFFAWFFKTISVNGSIKAIL